MASQSSTVDDYIAAQPMTARLVLTRVREAIRTAAPEAEEVISYKMPTYKVDGIPVLYFAGWKKHYSLYPISSELVAAFNDDFTPYEVEKSTVRFPFTTPVPERLIQRITRFRLNEIATTRTEANN